MPDNMNQAPTHEEGDAMLTRAEVAKRLRCCTRSVQRLEERKLLIGHRITRRVLYKWKDIQRLISNCEDSNNDGDNDGDNDNDDGTDSDSFINDRINPK